MHETFDFYNKKSYTSIYYINNLQPKKEQYQELHNIIYYENLSPWTYSKLQLNSINTSKQCPQSLAQSKKTWLPYTWYGPQLNSLKYDQTTFTRNINGFSRPPYSRLVWTNNTFQLISVGSTSITKVMAAVLALSSSVVL